MGRSNDPGMDGHCPCIGTVSLGKQKAGRCRALGGAENSSPLLAFDWQRLTLIDKEPWQPSSQSAKSNRKSFVGSGQLLPFNRRSAVIP